MTNATTTPRLVSNCPNFCAREHLKDWPVPDDATIYHDSEAGVVDLTRPIGTTHFSVTATREDLPQGGGGLPYIELDDDEREIARLSPKEAVDLAMHLLNAATAARDWLGLK